LIKAGARIGNAITAKNNRLLEYTKTAFAKAEDIHARGNWIANCNGSHQRISEAGFEGGSAANNVFGTRCVLYARQLHDDAISTLLLNDWLFYGQFIHALIEGGDVLLYRVVLYFFKRGWLELAQEASAAGLCAQLPNQVGLRGSQQCLGFFCFLGATKLNGDGFIAAFNALVANILFTQLTANITRNCQHFFLYRALHVHLQQEIHATAQIKTQGHWHRINRAEPMGCVGE